MHQFDASTFLAIATKLVELNQQLIEGRWVLFLPSWLESLKRDIINIRQQPNAMELDAAEVSAGELIEIVSRGHRYPDGKDRVFRRRYKTYQGFCQRYCGARYRPTAVANIFVHSTREAQPLCPT
jgi:hypothetical protein